MKQVLLLDNYDSFTYNLKHYISSLGFEVKVYRNNVSEVNLTDFSHVVLSPGPGLPKDAGIMMDLIEELDSKIPILGVCLGMQAIAEYLGGELYNQSIVKHGVSESITVSKSRLFMGVPNQFNVGLYHSWAVKGEGDYVVTGKSSLGTVMSIENQERKLYGVQFHPESVMTEYGQEILGNFLTMKI